jgi:hypothetical protein
VCTGEFSRKKSEYNKDKAVRIKISNFNLSKRNGNYMFQPQAYLQSITLCFICRFLRVCIVITVNSDYFLK